MNRKLCALIIAAAVAAASMSSCGSAGEEAETDGGNVSFEGILQTDESEQDKVFTADEGGYVCELDNGVRVELGARTDDVLQSLGIVTNQMEAPSCLYDGTDKVYEIDGAFNVTSTLMGDGYEHITQLSLINDSVAIVTSVGYMMIGSDQSILADAYGEPAENAFGMQLFNLAGCRLNVIVEGDRITSITYSLS